MNVTCPECQTVYRIDPAKVTSEKLRARCSVCGGVIAVGAASAWSDSFADVPERVATPRNAISTGTPVSTLAAPPPARLGDRPTPASTWPVLPPEPPRGREFAAQREPSPPLGVPVAGGMESALPSSAASMPVAPATPVEAVLRAAAPPLSAPRQAFEPSVVGPAVPESPTAPLGSVAKPSPGTDAPEVRRAVFPPIPAKQPDAPPGVPSPVPPPVLSTPPGSPAVPDRLAVAVPPTSAPTAVPGPAAGPRSTPDGRERSPLATPRRLTPIGGNPSYHRGPIRPASPAFGAPLAPPPRTSIPTPISSPASPAIGEPALPGLSSGRRPINPFLANDPNQKARRLARALVSDMIAYHPSKREEGLRNGTLKQLFREEIKKSYEEYTEQVGREFAEATTHFQDALNDVLSGGRKLF